MQKGQGGGSEGKGPQGIKGGLLTGGEHGDAGPWGTRDRLPKIRHRGATEAQRDHFKCPILNGRVKKFWRVKS